MNKKFIAFIKAALRRTWNRSWQRQTCLKSARVERGKYECAICNKLIRRADCEIDHISCVGKFVDFDTFIERLFCDPSGLQLLCKLCHKAKTKKDIKKMRK